MQSDEGKKTLPTTAAASSPSWEYSQAVRRVSSAPLLPSFADLRPLSAASATGSQPNAEKDDAPPPPAVRTTFEPAKVLAVTRSQPNVPNPTGETKPVPSLGMYMRQSSCRNGNPTAGLGAVPS